MGTTVTSSIGTLVSSRRREIVLLSAVLVAMFTLVSMVGWRPSDPTLLRPGTGTIENPCGWVGANLAELAFALVGHGAWILVLLVAIAVLGLAGRRVLSWGQWLVGGVLYAVVLGGVELALRPGAVHPPGGALGWSVSQGLETLVGLVGAWLVLVGAAVLLVTVLARIRWSAAASWVVERVEAVFPVVAGWTMRGTRGAAGLAGKGAAFAGRGAWSGVTSVTGSVSGLATRMGASLLRRRAVATDDDIDDDDMSWADDDDSDVWDDSVLSDVHDTDAVGGDTVVGGGRALVQAEWEPTITPSGSGEVLGLFPDFVPRDSTTGTADQTPVSVHRQTGPGTLESGDARPSVASAFVKAGRTPTSAGRATPRPVCVSVDTRTPPRVPSIRPSVPSAPSSVPGAPPSVPSAPPSVPSVAPSSAVPVHHNELLDQHISDDGRALRTESTFELPRLSLLDEVPEQRAIFNEDELRELAVTLEEKLASFGVRGTVVGVRPGPVVTIFEFTPDPGIKVSKIAGLSDDLAMALKALRVRIVAPIPGRGVVGIEIPSKRRLTVYLREVLANPEFRDTKAALPCILGKDVEGKPVITDLARMPHLLIGGTTGSGKSVGVNGMLMSLLFTRSPDELRLLLVDPKMLEFEMYNDIPHLLHPVVTDAKVATQALAWACREMDERYTLLARWGTRNIVNYNKKIEKELRDWTPRKARRYAPKDWPDSEPPPVPARLPYIVIVVDELADLMMVAGKEVEESICRIAQKARACGIHLIVATQRPSVDVVTGLIKANLPSRIAFQLRSRHDSRTVLDEMGAENLLGKGDMLYLPPGVGGLKRCHGAFVSDGEVASVTGFLREQGQPRFIQTLDTPVDELGGDFDAEMNDELYDAAVNLVIQSGKASTSMVQRHLKIGYNRAARIIDAMEAAGVIGPADGARPREVLVGAHP